MDYMNTVLDEFAGQLSYDDIKHMTYKELGYLRKHRTALNKRKGGTSQGLGKLLS